MPRPRHEASSREAAERLANTAPLVSRWIERLLAGHDPPLTVAQYLVLQAVESGEVVGAELARRAAVSPAAVSQVLGALEASGLLARQRAAADRRRQPIVLTARGREALGSARVLVRERLADLLGGLRGPEADALARLLARVEETLAGVAPPPRPHPPPRPAPHRRPGPRPS
jgi:DNA-binding MarR family transcriptional regulator